MRIISAVAGCNFDDLKQRDRKRRKNRMIMLAAIAFAVVAILVIAGAKSIESTTRAQISESYKLASESEALLAQGDRYGAISKALEALPKGNSPFERPLVDEARKALVNALELDTDGDLLWRPSYSIKFDDQIVDCVTEPNHGWIAVMDASIGITTFDYETGKKLATITPRDQAQDDSHTDIDSKPNCWKMVPAGDKLIVEECTGSGVFACYDAKTGQIEWAFPPVGMRATETAFDGRAFYVCNIVGREVYGGVLDKASKKPLASNMIEMPEAPKAEQIFLPIAVNENGLMFVGIGTHVANAP